MLNILDGTTVQVDCYMKVSVLSKSGIEDKMQPKRKEIAAANILYVREEVKWDSEAISDA